MGLSQERDLASCHRLTVAAKVTSADVLVLDSDFPLEIQLWTQNCSTSVCALGDPILAACPSCQLECGAVAKAAGFEQGESGLGMDWW